MLRRPLTVVFVALALSSTVGGQRTGPSVAQVRVVSARLIAAESGDGIPYGRVSVVPSGSEAVSTTRTDLEGRFTISIPAAGRQAHITKAGFVAQDLALNADTPAEIRLVRAAVIAGRVSDDAADPVPNVQVRAERDAEDGPPVSGTVRTDDRGDYRVGGLPPGRYRVSIESSLTYAPAKLSYPGTEDREQAARIPLAAGQTQFGIDMRLRRLREGRVASSSGTGDFMLLPLPGMTARFDDPFGGTVRGAVRSTDGRPLDHAHVQIFMNAMPASFWSQSSDAAGQFEFTGLPPGRYTLQAFKVGFSPADGSGDRPRSILVGQAVEIQANTVHDRQEIRLAPWGVITGRILDEYGDPVAGAKPSLYSVRYESGRRGLVAEPVGIVPSDDEGTYRIFGVPPGSYVVGASVGDVTTSDTAGYARSFYPATSSPAQARFVPIARSQTVYGIDVPLEVAASVRVSGRLLDAAGAPTMGGAVHLVPTARSVATINVMSGASIQANGQFEFRNVPPGAYIIRAGFGMRGGATEGQFGVLPVEVGNTSITNLVLQLSAGSTIAGHITYDSATERGARPSSAVEITPLPADPDTAPQQVAKAQPAANGTFSLAGISGPRRLRVRAPEPWAVKEILLNGVDITDRVLTLGGAAQSLGGIEVVLTDRLARLSGRVSDAQNRGLAGATVIAFSVDRDTWYPESRFVRMSVSGDDGAYAVGGLPAGTYQVAAVARVPPGTDAWQDPVFLEELSRVTRTTAVGDGERQTLPLRLTPP